MAIVRIIQEDRALQAPGEIRDFLRPFGIDYDCWPVAGRVDRDASAEEILQAYAPEVENLKARGGYITADVVDVTPEVPNLQAMLDKFNKEHRHAEDEVRFVVKGRGIFYIHPEDSVGPLFSIQVEEGDTSTAPYGLGTYGSRSTPVAGAAIAPRLGKRFGAARAFIGCELMAAPAALLLTLANWAP